MRLKLKGVYSNRKRLADGAYKTYFTIRGVGALNPLPEDEGEVFAPGTPAFMRAYNAAIAAPQKARTAGTLQSIIDGYQQLVKDFIQLHLEVWDEFYADPTSILPKAEELLPEIDPEVLAQLAEEYADKEIFPPDGDLAEEETQYTLDFFSEAAGFENVGSYEDIADRQYLDAVL